MNQLDVAALEGVLECERCWKAVILSPSPKVDGCKEEDCNLLDEKPQPFRPTKCAGKKSQLSSHSRQHTNGIRIPTKFPAVPGEWDNVKAQFEGWAWKGGSILMFIFIVNFIFVFVFVFLFFFVFVFVFGFRTLPLSVSLIEGKRTPRMSFVPESILGSQADRMVVHYH